MEISPTVAQPGWQQLRRDWPGLPVLREALRLRLGFRFSRRHGEGGPALGGRGAQHLHDGVPVYPPRRAAIVADWRAEACRDRLEYGFPLRAFGEYFDARDSQIFFHRHLVPAAGGPERTGIGVG